MENYYFFWNDFKIVRKIDEKNIKYVGFFSGEIGND